MRVGASSRPAKPSSTAAAFPRDQEAACQYQCPVRGAIQDRPLCMSGMRTLTSRSRPADDIGRNMIALSREQPRTGMYAKGSGASAAFVFRTLSCKSMAPKDAGQPVFQSGMASEPDTDPVGCYSCGSEGVDQRLIPALNNLTVFHDLGINVTAFGPADKSGDVASITGREIGLTGIHLGFCRCIRLSSYACRTLGESAFARCRQLAVPEQGPMPVLVLFPDLKL